MPIRQRYKDDHIIYMSHFVTFSNQPVSDHSQVLEITGRDDWI